jgi:hypothetical protein
MLHCDSATGAPSVPAQLSGFIEDLLAVLKAYAAMAGAYCSLWVGKGAWSDFARRPP